MSTEAAKQSRSPYEAAAWLKVDLHIMPVAVLLYLASYIDR